MEHKQPIVPHVGMPWKIIALKTIIVVLAVIVMAYWAKEKDHCKGMIMYGIPITFSLIVPFLFYIGESRNEILLYTKSVCYSSLFLFTLLPFAFYFWYGVQELSFAWSAFASIVTWMIAAFLVYNYVSL